MYLVEKRAKDDRETVRSKGMKLEQIDQRSGEIERESRIPEQWSEVGREKSKGCRKVWGNRQDDGLCRPPEEPKNEMRKRKKEYYYESNTDVYAVLVIVWAENRL